MYPIIMWLWGAIVASVWWVTILMLSTSGILIVPAVVSSAITLAALIAYCAKNWKVVKKEE